MESGSLILLRPLITPIISQPAKTPRPQYAEVVSQQPEASKEPQGFQEERRGPDPPQETTAIILAMVQNLAKEIKEMKAERNQWLNQNWYQFPENQQC